VQLTEIPSQQRTVSFFIFALFLQHFSFTIYINNNNDNNNNNNGNNNDKNDIYINCQLLLLSILCSLSSSTTTTATAAVQLLFCIVCCQRNYVANPVNSVDTVVVSVLLLLLDDFCCWSFFLFVVTSTITTLLLFLDQTNQPWYHGNIDNTIHRIVRIVHPKILSIPTTNWRMMTILPRADAVVVVSGVQIDIFLSRTWHGYNQGSVRTTMMLLLLLSSCHHHLYVLWPYYIGRRGTISIHSADRVAEHS
jgi:hypothetical protein